MKMTQIPDQNLSINHQRASIENKKFLCMNPICKVIGLKFLEQNEVGLHQDCTGWIININDIKKIVSSQTSQNIDPNTQNTFDFKFSPLKSLYDIGSVFHSPQNSQSSLGANNSLKFNNPIELLKINFELIKNKIESELARVFYEISDRIQKIQYIQTKTVSEIKNILSQNDVHQISESIKQSTELKQYKEFCKVTELFTLIHEQKITKEIFKIFQSIQNIGRSFWNSQLQSFKRQREILQNAKKNVENFTKNETTIPYVKLQSLANIFQAKNILPSVSQDKMSSSIKCWICQKQFYGKGIKLKQHKSQACDILIKHIMNDHQAEAMSKFICQIMKTAIHKITYEQLLTEIQEKNYEQYVIIDRQNSNKGIEEFISTKVSDNTFIVNVLSSRNQNIAAGKYILANSAAKDSADTLMIMIIYAIVTSGFYRFTRHFYPEKKPKITLMTKDHFAESLQNILKNDFDAQLQIVK